MAFSKIILNSATLMDVTQDTVAADNLLSGYTATGADGETVTGTYTPPSGGGGVDGDVIFIDYDGTELYGLSKAEINAMTSDSDLPANPSHNGLTAQGWNWTVAQLKSVLANVTRGEKLVVGQMYTTTSGATEIDVDMQELRKSPYLSFAINGTATIDWGDNTSTDTVTGSSLTTRVDTQHTYASGGKYTIKITVPSGSEAAFYASGTYPPILKDPSSNANVNTVYADTISAVRVGSRMRIDDYAFERCFGIRYITIPNGVTSIGQYAFYEDCNFQSITIPSGVTSIGKYAFYNCYTLKNPSIPGSVTSIGDYAFNHNEISEYICLPRLSDDCLYYCRNLKSVILHGDITSIGVYAVSNVQSLVSLAIPSTVTSISANAFTGNYGMKEYHFLPTSPPTLANTNAFNNISNDCIIYVPQGCSSAYKSATNWSSSSIKNKIQEEPS